MMLSSDLPCWFFKSPLSHNKLDSMMKMISEAAGLSYSYTNHCLRATSITHMKRCGIEDRKICTVTGHKNVNSLAADNGVIHAESARFADAIDLKVPECSVSERTEISQSAVTKATSHTSLCSDQGDTSPSGFVFNAQGATFSNVVFKVHASKPKKRFCLSLKERRKETQRKNFLAEQCDQ